MSNVGTLPLEIFTDILSRLPVKFLCRFKSVSLSWNSLISSPHFAKTHLDRTKTQKNPKHLDQRIFILTTNQNLHHKQLIFSHDFYSVDFADANPTATKLDFPMVERHATPDSLVEVCSSCDGLLLVSRLDNSHHVLKIDNYSFFLLNPSTRKYKKLPMLPFAIDPARGALLSFHGVGYDSFTDDYKVLMIFGWGDDTTYQSYRDSYVGVVVAYSRNTDSWKRIQDFPFMHVSRSGGVFFNGSIHCLCWGRTGPTVATDTHVIVAFDWSDEIFREVPLPAWFDGHEIPNLSVADLGSCLCLVNGGDLTRSNLVEVWMMEKYGVRESCTKFSIGVTTWYGVEVLCSLAEDKFLVRTDANKLTVHCEREIGCLQSKERNTE